MKGKILYSKIKIKKLGIQYLDHCIKLDKETLNGIWTERQWKDELTCAKRMCFGALHQTKLIGLISGWLATDEINITFVGVHPLFQNQGIASLMVLSLLSSSKEIGISTATLEVKESNQAAKSLYESLNFRQIGFRNKLYKDGSNALIYQFVYN